MADGLPASGYTTNTLRTTAEVRAAIDDVFDVVARLIGAVAAESAEITTGALSPSAAFVQVDNEGSVGADFLDTISPTNYSDGNVIVLVALTPGNTTTIRHDQGADGIMLEDAANWGLTSSRWIELRYDSTASRWVEIRRGYGQSDIAGARAALGLGSAALLNDGAVDAATLGGVAASGYVEVGDPVGDADTVDGIHAAGLVQTALGSLQTMAGNLQVNSGSIISNVNLANESRFILDIDDAKRGEILFFRDAGAASYLTFRIYDTDGTTLLREFKFVANESAPTFFDGTTTKTFQMVEDMPTDHLTGSVHHEETSGTLNADTDRYDVLNLHNDWFGFTAACQGSNGGESVSIGPERGTSSTDRANPKLAIFINPGITGDLDYEAKWSHFNGLPAAT